MFHYSNKMGSTVKIIKDHRHIDQGLNKKIGKWVCKIILKVGIIMVINFRNIWKVMRIEMEKFHKLTVDIFYYF